MLLLRCSCFRRLKQDFCKVVEEMVATALTEKEERGKLKRLFSQCIKEAIEDNTRKGRRMRDEVDRLKEEVP